MPGKYQEGVFRIAFADLEYGNSEMNYFARVKRYDPGIYVNWSVVSNLPIL